VTRDGGVIKIKAGLTQQDIPATKVVAAAQLSHLPARLPFSTGAVSLLLFRQSSSKVAYIGILSGFFSKFSSINE